MIRYLHFSEKMTLSSHKLPSILTNDDGGVDFVALLSNNLSTRNVDCINLCFPSPHCMQKKFGLMLCGKGAKQNTSTAKIATIKATLPNFCFVTDECVVFARTKCFIKFKIIQLEKIMSAEI